MIGSRQRIGNPKNDEFYTPQFIFDALGVRFDLDVAAPMLVETNVPANAYCTQENDGLTAQWHGFVWMNPPFSNSTPWVQRFIEHANGIALVPTSKARWFTDMWNHADAIVLLPSRFKFDRKDDQRSDIFMPTVLAAIGDQGRTALVNSNLGKVR